VSLLGSVFTLHDADDVEKLARRALEDALRASGAHLRAHEHADAVAFLIAECWRISIDFDPSRGLSFSTYAFRTLRRRYVDFLRQEHRTVWKFKDRTHTRVRPTFVPIDSGDGELGPALAGSSLDGDTPGFADQLRALGARSRRPGGRDRRLGEEAA
jgi:DNA-directed RNA polymerase specialized sigma24 family protein